MSDTVKATIKDIMDRTEILVAPAVLFHRFEEVVECAAIGRLALAQLDRAALASLASVYTGQGKFFEKLEEKLGKEGAEAVGGWLDQILRGRKQER